jgi:hypothetical protein
MEIDKAITESVAEVDEEMPSVAEPTKIIKPRSDAQKIALEKARVRAVVVRQENATRKKEEIATAAQNKENEAQKPDDVADSDSEEELPVEPVRPPKRKKARRVVVTEMSSDSDVEIVIPKNKRRQPERSPRKMQYERAVKKMFEYQ